MRTRKKVSSNRHSALPMTPYLQLLVPWMLPMALLIPAITTTMLTLMKTTTLSLDNPPHRHPPLATTMTTTLSSNHSLPNPSPPTQRASTRSHNTKPRMITRPPLLLLSLATSHPPAPFAWNRTTSLMFWSIPTILPVRICTIAIVSSITLSC